MKCLGLSAADISRRTDIPAASLSRYTKGRIPAALELWKIACVLEVSMEWLLTGEENKFSERSLSTLREDDPEYKIPGSNASGNVKKALSKTGELLEEIASLLQNEWKEKGK